MRHQIGRLLALAACQLAVGWCTAADWYVDNVRGNEDFTGRMAEPNGPEGPVPCIGQALCLAGPSDRVLIANTGVPYREMLSISGPRLRGRATKPLVIDGQGAVLDGSVETAPGGWQPVGRDFFALRPRRLTHQRVFSANKPLPYRESGGMEHAKSLLEPGQWSMTAGHLVMRVAAGKLPADYGLRHSGLQTGITLYQTEHVQISGLVIQGFQLDAVSAPNLVTNCELLDLDCRACGRSGISLAGTSRVSAQRCNLYENGEAQVSLEGLARLTLTGCDVEREPVRPYQTAPEAELEVDGKSVLAP